MSININVHGNPESYSFNKNALCNFDSMKDAEYKRRKLLRLEQVRQQSKDIAANVRQKVRHEKERQIARIEEIKADEIRAWKEKHFAKTQHEYNNCLSNVGEAHLAAANENEISKRVQEQRLKNRKLAENRGREALLKVKQRNEKKKCLVKAKKAVTVATQVNSPIASLVENQKDKSPKNVHVYADVHVNQPSNTSNSSSNSSVLPFSQRQQKLYTQKINGQPEAADIIDLSSNSLSSSIEIMTKGSKLSKTLPLACSKEVFVNNENATGKVSSVHSLVRPSTAGRYNPSDFVAETSSESNSLQDPINSPVFTKVSDLISMRQMSRSVSTTENKITPVNPVVRNTTDTVPKSMIENSTNDLPRKTACNSIVSPVKTREPSSSTQSPIKSTRTRLKSCLRSSTSLLEKTAPVGTLKSSKVNTPLKRITKKTTPTRKSVCSLNTKSSTNKFGSPTRLIRKEFVPLFTKPPTATKLSIEGQAIPRTQHNIWPVPVQSAATTSQPSSSSTTNSQKVKFYDHSNRFSKEYDQPENIVQKMVPNDEQPTAMTAAQEEIQLDAERARHLQELKQMTELRCHQSMERQKVRKDYDLLTAQLEELSKKESYSKIYANPNSQFSEDRLRKMAEERQHQMNERFEDILNKPVLITCPRISKITNNEGSGSDLNVASDTQFQRETGLNLSNESCSSFLLGYVNNRSKDLITDIDRNEQNGNNTEELLDLLRRINYQKSLLVQEIAKTKGVPNKEVPSSNLENVFKTVRSLEKTKNEILSDGNNKENQLKDERKQIEKREQLVKMKEQKLEERIRELYEKEQQQQRKPTKTKSNIEIKSNAQTEDVVVVQSNDDSLGSSQSSFGEAPIKIIINVDGKRKKKSKSPRRVLLQKNQRHKSSMCSLSDKPGESFPKTPAKKCIAKAISSDAKKNPSNLSVENPIDDSSTSTDYRNLPFVMQTELTKQLKKNTTTMPTKEAIKITTPALGQYISRLLGMSRASIEQLGVSSVSSVETPSSSVINTSANVSVCSEEVPVIDEERLNKLKKFIEDNHSFLNELEQSLKETNLNRTEDANMKTVETVWMKTLQKQESEMHKLKRESKRLKTVLKEKEIKNAQQKMQQEIKRDQQKLEEQRQHHQLIQQEEMEQHRQQQQLELQKQSNQQREQQKEQREQQIQMPIKPILKKQQSPKKVQVMDKTGTEDETLLHRYVEITENCNKRIADLTDMINKVRLEKQKLLEGTFSSMTSNATDKGQNSTEYLDFVDKQRDEARQSNNSSDASGVQTLTGTSKDGGTTDNSPLKLANSRPFGISRDSGISVISRPSADIQISPDQDRDTLFSTGNMAQPDSVNKEALSNTSQSDKYRVEYLNDGDVLRVERVSPDNMANVATLPIQPIKQRPTKPPTSLTRYSPQVDQQQEHELSVIAEVDTPATSRIHANDTVDSQKHILQQPASLSHIHENTMSYEFSADTKEALHIRKFRSPPKGNSLNSTTDGEYTAVDQLQIRPYPPHSEYAKNLSGLCDSLSIKNYKNDDNRLMASIKIKMNKFQSHKEYVAGMSGLCDSTSIDALIDTTDIQPDDTSLPDIEAELKRRNIIERPFDTMSSGSSERAIQELNAMDEELKKFIATESGNNSSDDLENDMKKIGLNWASSMIKTMKEKKHTMSSSTSSSSLEKSKSPRKTRKINQSTNSFLDSKLNAFATEHSAVAENNDSRNSTQSGKPLNLKEFLARELLKRSQSNSSSNDDSTLASQFLRSLLGSSDSSTQHNVLHHLSEKHTTQRTSTPVKPVSSLTGGGGSGGGGGAGSDDPTKSPPTNYLFSGESGISSVRASSMSTSGKETSKSLSNSNETNHSPIFDALNVPDLKLNIPSKSSSSTS